MGPRVSYPQSPEIFPAYDQLYKQKRCYLDIGMCLVQGKQIWKYEGSPEHNCMLKLNSKLDFSWGRKSSANWWLHSNLEKVLLVVNWKLYINIIPPLVYHLKSLSLRTISPRIIQLIHLDHSINPYFLKMA